MSLVCFIPRKRLTRDAGAKRRKLPRKIKFVSLKWLGHLALCARFKMMEKTSLDKKIANLFTPITQKLFKGESDAAHSYIAVNLASNMLGMGGAATPAGIKAIAAMDTGSESASKNMIMFLVINATSIQILPATVMALMGTHGSASPSSIIIPSLIATAVSTLTGIILVKIFTR